jgi:cytochrome c peroxidase
MHDGRFKSLEEVLDHYNTGIKRSPTLDILLKEGSNEIVNPNEPVDLGLTDQEKEDIIAFLHMLTDEDFVSNPRFSNPFTNAE